MLISYRGKRERVQLDCVSALEMAKIGIGLPPHSLWAGAFDQARVRIPVPLGLKHDAGVFAAAETTRESWNQADPDHLPPQQYAYSECLKDAIVGTIYAVEIESSGVKVSPTVAGNP